MTNPATTTAEPGYSLPANSTACGKEWLVRRRAVVLAQAAAHEQMARTLKEEAALLAKEAGLTERRSG